jgi:hypothetical protein
MTKKRPSGPRGPILPPSPEQLAAVLELRDQVLPGYPDLARRALSRIVGESTAPVLAGARRISDKKLVAWRAAVVRWRLGSMTTEQIARLDEVRGDRSREEMIGVLWGQRAR